MIPSPAGIMMCGVLLLLGAMLRAPVLGGFLASLAFGSTAIGTLTSLGGSSPLIYAPLGALLVVTVFSRQGAMPALVKLIVSNGPVLAMMLLAIHAIASAIVLPRLFRGQITAFVPIAGVVTEIPLGPSSGNLTQTAYLLLGVACCLAIILHATSPTRFGELRAVFLGLCTVQAALGVIDLAGKLAGAGDVLLPIRSASYALLTETQVSAGLWRIAGGFSEAAAFSAFSLPCLAYAFTDWRVTGSKRSALLTVALAALTLLSTSTTAYVGLTLLAVPFGLSLLAALFRGRIARVDAVLLVGGFALVTLAGIAVALGSHFVDSVLALLDEMIFNKLASDSGVERAYWNMRSLEAFVDSYGLGIGMGSSRASSLVVAIVSQLGVAGVLVVGYLIAFLVAARRSDSFAPSPSADTEVVARAARAMALGSFAAGAISAGSADPGTLFFVSLGAVIAARRLDARTAPSPAPRPDPYVPHPQWT